MCSRGEYTPKSARFNSLPNLLTVMKFTTSKRRPSPTMSAGMLIMSCDRSRCQFPKYTASASWSENWPDALSPPSPGSVSATRSICSWTFASDRWTATRRPRGRDSTVVGARPGAACV